MSAITTHVLDTVLGKPGSGIHVDLEQHVDGNWIRIGEGVTDADGRCSGLAINAAHGTYRLTFATGAYLKRQARSSIFPTITVTFEFGGDTHFHLPLLLSDNSYTTYRGS